VTCFRPGPSGNGCESTGADLRPYTPVVADESIDVLVETPKGSRVKYEWDDDRGAIRFDRRLVTATVFPADYGRVADAIGADGETLDAVVLTEHGTFPGCWVRARPVGVFWIAYDDVREAKVLAVPEGDPDYADVLDIDDLPTSQREEISHFFEVYKDLGPGRALTAAGYDGQAVALEVISDARRAAQF
jgi:inorganic pyrophosphatase